jgi:hypothetical protein
MKKQVKKSQTGRKAAGRKIQKYVPYILREKYWDKQYVVEWNEKIENYPQIPLIADGVEMHADGKKIYDDRKFMVILTPSGSKWNADGGNDSIHCIVRGHNDTDFTEVLSGKDTPDKRKRSEYSAYLNKRVSNLLRIAKTVLGFSK